MRKYWERLVSQYGSSTSAPLEYQAFVTKETFEDKLGRIESALQTLLAKQDSASGSKCDTGMTSPFVTKGG